MSMNGDGYEAGRARLSGSETRILYQEWGKSVVVPW